MCSVRIDPQYRIFLSPWESQKQQHSNTAARSTSPLILLLLPRSSEIDFVRVPSLLLLVAVAGERGGMCPERYSQKTSLVVVIVVPVKMLWPPRLPHHIPREQRVRGNSQNSQMWENGKWHFATVTTSKTCYPRNRPCRPIGFWDVEDPTLSRQSAHS
jgi:hypothetical protein